MNALAKFIPADERLVTIEDSAELQLQHKHVVRLETRTANNEGTGEITQRSMVRNALRMRPDRIIVGEVRGSEAIDMLQAMNTGHEGSLTTIHANDTRDALARLEMMVAMSGFELPIPVVRQYIASGISLVVHLSRLKGGVRRVMQVSEIVGIAEGDSIWKTSSASSKSASTNKGSLRVNSTSPATVHCASTACEPADSACLTACSTNAESL